MTDDPRDLYLAAVETFASLVERIRPDQWHRPGLGDWDVRALTGHASRSLITVLTYLGQSAETEEIPTPEDYYLTIATLDIDPAEVAERGRQAGVALGDDPALAVRELQRQVRERLAVADLNAVITTLVGGMRLRQYLPTRVFELVVHGQDLAHATGQPTPQDEGMTAAVHLAAALALRTGHGPTVLRALTGRAGLPGGFSLV